MENYNVSESEEILREIKEVKKENPLDPRLDELWNEYYEAVRWEYEERYGINYAERLKRIM